MGSSKGRVELGKKLMRAFRSSILLLGCMGLLTARADFSTGFETTDGSYVAGSTVIGVDDNSAPGTNKWTAFLGTTTNTGVITATTSYAQSGSQALNINDTTNATAYAAYLNLTSGATNFSGTFKLHFGLNIQSVSTGTTNQIQIYLGQAITDPGGTNGGRYWTGLIYNNGVLQLLYDGTTTAMYTLNLGNYTTYAALGEYVTFDITMDGATKKYTGLQITSSTGVVTDLTSTVQTLTLPWVPGSTLGGLVANADPAYNLMVVTGTDDTASVTFDNFSLSTVPEPAAWALVVCSAVATFGYRIRRHN